MNRPSLIVHVNRLRTAPELRRGDVTRAVRATAAAEGVDNGEFSVTFLDPDAIAALNLEHLGRNGPTDVISFQLAEPDSPLGDIYICPAVARQSAVEYDVRPAEELLRLVVHGTLHVLGYDHPDGPDRSQSDMFRRQESILAGLTRHAGRSSS